MRIALVRDGLVLNVIEAEADFIPHAGEQALPALDAGPGWTFDGKDFHRPPEAAAAATTVSMFQAREALRRTAAPTGGNLLDAVNAYVESKRLDAPTLSLAWEYAVEVERHGAFVMALAAIFGLDDAALDDLFRLAATISA